MSFLDEIKKQPRHVREIMFGLSVVTTISLAGMVWYNSFQKDIFALLNPEEAREQRFATQENQKTLFGMLNKTLGDLGSAFSGLFAFDKSGLESGPEIKVEKEDADKVYLLPLSGQK